MTNDGPHYPLPYPGGSGLGKPLKPIVHPLRADIPIILGAEGPKNIALAAEIADGWFPIFFSPRAMSSFEASLDEGFARPGARRSAADFEVLAFAPTVIADDVEAAADGFRPYLALYIGGMGAKEMNFHFDVFARMGYEEAAHKIQDAYLDGRKDDAAAAVPTAMVEDIALVGPAEKIRDDLDAWRESRATTMLVNGDVATLRTIGRAGARLRIRENADGAPAGSALLGNIGCTQGRSVRSLSATGALAPWTRRQAWDAGGGWRGVSFWRPSWSYSGR